MENIISAKEYLKQEKIYSYLVLGIIISIIIGTFILMLYVPLLFFLNPLAIFILIGYIYVMVKKFQFIRIVERILNSNGTEDRLNELYINLGRHIKGIKESVTEPRKLWAGEISYNRVNTNKFLLANVDYKIIKKVYEIYNKK